VNGTYYRDELLSDKMLPAIRQIAGEQFSFQQDNMPAHRTRDTVEFLRRSTRPVHRPRLVANKQHRSESGGLQDLGSDTGASIQDYMLISLFSA